MRRAQGASLASGASGGRWSARGEGGQALLVVLSVLLVLTLIPMTLVAATSQRVPLTIALQNGESAASAAQAGLSDYTGHLTADSYYPAKYNQTKGYAGSSNNAFTQWVAVPQSVDEYYSYRVLPGSPSTTPTYTILVAGCTGVLPNMTSPCTGPGTHPGNQIDVISRQVQLSSSFFNAYFTKYELYDPNDPNYYPGGSLPSSTQINQVASHCVALASTPNANGSFPAPVETPGLLSEGTYSQNGGYGPDLGWSTRINGSSVGCRTAMWQNQTTQGPIASMDNFFFCGSPNFQSQVSANKANPFWVPLNNTVYWLWYYNSQSCADNPHFGGNGVIQPIAYQHLPSLTVYEQEAEIQPTQSSNSFGCYYYGSTTMVFNSNGTVDVSSPNSQVGTGTGYTNPGCPLGNNNPKGFESQYFNGAVYVGGTNTGGCTASVGPTPPPGWGPPVFELGYNPQGGNGFSGLWEPQQVGSTPSNSPNGWTLSWETNDPACQGDLFVQGTVTKSITLAAYNNLYLTGSVCVPADTTCQQTNQTNTNGQGNDMGAVSYSQSDLASAVPSGSPMIGVVAGNMVKAYNPTNTPSNYNILDWGYSIQNTISIKWCVLVPCGVNGGLWFQANMYFSGGGLAQETQLEGYPHANIVVDGVVFDLGGGTTTQQMPNAEQAGATASDMTDPNPFNRIGLSYPGLANFDVNGASVEKFAPNLSCNQVTLPFVGNTGTCATDTLLEIPLPGLNLEVFNVGNGACPSNVPQPLGPPPTNGIWGPIDIIGTANYQLAGFTIFAYCAYVNAYQYVLSHQVGYTANFVYNPSLSAGLPPWFPNPEPQSVETATLSPSGSTVHGAFGSLLTG
ncbi:MAG: hypothetical protein M0035_06805 [Actinomycetota bacterium]|nr:hypothetical protein [Actinomycetota bacterium]